MVPEEKKCRAAIDQRYRKDDDYIARGSLDVGGGTVAGVASSSTGGATPAKKWVVIVLGASHLFWSTSSKVHRHIVLPRIVDQRLNVVEIGMDTSKRFTMRGAASKEWLLQRQGSGYGDSWSPDNLLFLWIDLGNSLSFDDWYERVSSSAGPHRRVLD